MSAKAYCAAIVYLLREHNGKTEVLVHKRQGGWGAGLWDASAGGHVEEGETMTTALMREAKEELGIKIDAKDIIFTNIQQFRAQSRVYFDGYFFVKKYKGKPHIMEPEKCSDLQWCDINNLPEPFRPERKQALKDFLAGKTFTEFGF